MSVRFTISLVLSVMTFVTLTQQPIATTFRREFSVQMLDQRSGWIIDGEDLYTTVDGGVSWERVTQRLHPVMLSRSGAETFDGLKGEFSDIHTGWLMVGSVAIVRTLDGGASWSDASPGDQHCNGAALTLKEMEFRATGSGVVLATCREADAEAGFYGQEQETHLILSTMDGGDSWDSSEIALSVIRQTGIDRDGVVWVLAKGTLEISSDAGRSWRSIEIPEIGVLRGFARLDDSAFILGGRSVWMTADGGSNWALRDLEGDWIFEQVTAASPSRAWVIGKHYAPLTSSGRRVTSTLFSVETQGNLTPSLNIDGVVLAYDFLDDRHGWIVARPNTEEERSQDQLEGQRARSFLSICRTSDGGETWTSVFRGRLP